ncbi:MAG: ATP12 family chaperone protein [Rhodovibrio sp.]|nr:ATP12 family chaperone protein [Rhodovibrio sp.]
MRASTDRATEPLAKAVAQEWADQGDKVEPQTMPLTALACTAHDVAVPRRQDLVSGIARYAETDLVCYRAPQPQALAEREQEVWQPLLDWLALTFDAASTPPPASCRSTSRRRRSRRCTPAVERYDAMHLAALSSSVHVAGSMRGRPRADPGSPDADQAFDAAEVERSYQIEQWGEDKEASEERESLKRDLDAAERFVEPARRLSGPWSRRRRSQIALRAANSCCVSSA